MYWNYYPDTAVSPASPGVEVVDYHDKYQGRNSPFTGSTYESCDCSHTETWNSLTPSAPPNPLLLRSHHPSYSNHKYFRDTSNKGAVKQEKKVGAFLGTEVNTTGDFNSPLVTIYFSDNGRKRR